MVGLTSAAFVLGLEIYADWKAKRLQLKFQSKKSLVDTLEVLSAPLQLIRRRSFGALSLSESQTSSGTRDGSIGDDDEGAKIRRRYSVIRFYEIGSEGRTMF